MKTFVKPLKKVSATTLLTAAVILLLGALLPAPDAVAEPRNETEVKFTVTRLSDRVLVLTEHSPMENNVVALASRKGLVVVDSTGSPAAAAEARRLIEREFGRSDFAFLVNTHHHWDHAGGNQVFADTVIIGHEHCVMAMRWDESQQEQMLERMEQRLEEARTRLESLDPGSEEAAEMRGRIAFTERNYLGRRDGFVVTPPTLTFNDRMTLDLGDLTLKMVYFGSAHSGNDILIEVPEEGILLTGDLFLDRGWMPLFCGMRRLDVPRFIEVLGTVLAGDTSVRLVIPGHQEIWSREKLELWREYIVHFWTAVVEAQEAGIDLDSFLESHPMPKKYFYLESIGHDPADILTFHRRNMRAFWRQFKESAAEVLAQKIAEYGADAAIKAFAQVRAQESEYNFDEYEFNALGYRLLFEGKTGDAVAVFKLNVEMYPESWNVYDSLGEALLKAGEKDRAIALYRKSLELNPNNENGKEMLRRLGITP